MAKRTQVKTSSSVSFTRKMSKKPQAKLPTVSSIDWSPETVQTIYRDWGIYYTHKQKLKTAAHYYGKSLELKGNDQRALYHLSQCKRDIAEPASAMKDTAKAMEYNELSSPIDLEYCDAVYETNAFETCKVELLNKSTKYHGSKVESFQNRLEVVDEVFKDTVGDSLDTFLRNNERHLTGIVKEMQSQRNPDTRHLWKILQEQQKCDVLSVLEKEEVVLSPLEIARRTRSFKVFNQVYFNTSWLDALFLKNLRQNRSLLLPQSFNSTPILRQTAHSKYDVVQKFLKMLHCRSPMYNYMGEKFPNKKLREKCHEDYLNRVQYQTHRNMQTILRNARILRKMGYIERLSQYVEDIMGDYVVLKTHRVMPWKYEFVHEVYNILALARADHLNISEQLSKRKDDERLSVSLGLRTSRPKEVKTYVFGDRSTYLELDEMNRAVAVYKQLISRYEKRLRFAKYGIERSYLLHEIARTHLAHSHFDECVANARKGIEEARNAGSNIWEFLSMMVMFKSYSSLNKLEYSRELLNEIKLVVNRLKDPKIAAFIDMCSAINDADIVLRRRFHNSKMSIAASRSRRKDSKQSSSDASMMYSRINSRTNSIRSSKASLTYSQYLPSNSNFLYEKL